MRRLAFPVLIAVLTVGLTACGSESTESSSTASSSSSTESTTAPSSASASDAAADEAPAGGPTPVADTAFTTSQSGLKIHDFTTGDGAEATDGDRVTVHYTGWLASDSTKFDSSRDRGEPFQFNLGAGEVIQGWDQGVQGMNVGGTRQLVIPPDLGYGARGAGGAIPPNATLIFEVELLEVNGG
jgi:FKBP-type peptidyl-prolyl cis-trans isomerase